MPIYSPALPWLLASQPLPDARSFAINYWSPFCFPAAGMRTCADPTTDLATNFSPSSSILAGPHPAMAPLQRFMIDGEELPTLDDSTAPTTPDGSSSFSPELRPQADLGLVNSGPLAATVLDAAAAAFHPVRNICCVGAGFVGGFHLLPPAKTTESRNWADQVPTLCVQAVPRPQSSPFGIPISASPWWTATRNASEDGIRSTPRSTSPA